MKTAFLAVALCGLVAAGCAETPSASPGAATNASAAPGVTRATVVATMRRVADWQLAHPSKHATTDWTQAPFYSGLMAAGRATGDAKYLDAMIGIGEHNKWKLGPKKYHADDQAVGKAYAEVYALKKDPKIIADMVRKFDAILATPAADFENLKITRKGGTDVWSWCDALYMAPPAWAALSAATGDKKYLEYADREYRRTHGFLYDTKQHLFFRDNKYFDKKESNGASVFWGRGNGWVIAGLADLLKVLPKEADSRPFYEKLYGDMAAKLAECQQAEGAWRASLLDPSAYPAPEMSSTGLIAYGIAYGVNAGILDRAKYRPVLDKAWVALSSHVFDDGKLGSVQPIGEAPRKMSPSDTEVYGAGAFLQFGEEYAKLADSSK